MKTTLEILKEAKAVKRVLCSLSTEEKNKALLYMAEALLENAKEILKENKKDLENAKGTISEVMLDRLALSQERIEVSHRFKLGEYLRSGLWALL